jgi:hypothetical protein
VNAPVAPRAAAPEYAVTAKAGWIAIAVGGFVAVAGAGFMVVAGVMERWSGPAVRDANAWPAAQAGSIALLQVVIGTVSVIAGIAMLRRRAWSRSVLEGLCWTTALEIVLIAVGANKYAAITPSRALSQMSPGPPGMPFFMFGLVGVLMYLFAAVMAIRALRSAAMYAELEDPPQQ